MSRIMYDSDNIDDIPENAEIVAFYDDGEPGTPTQEQLSRFAGRPLVSITRKVGVKAKVVDVEPRCVWPPSEARQQIENGDSDTVYCNLNDWNTEVQAALQGLTFALWLADFDGKAEVPVINGVNVVAKQYANSVMTGGHYDVSAVSDTWPVPVQTPEVPPVADVGPQDTGDQPIQAADGKMELQAPIVDAIWVAGGCYMVAADGGVFTRDAAVFHGAIPGLKDAQGNPIKLHAAICTIIAQDHTGYTLIAEDGGTFRFGNGPDVQAL